MNQPILLFFNLGGSEIAVIMLFVLLFFGADKMPELARGLGKGMRQFKDAMAGIEQEVKKAANSVEQEVQKAIEQPKETTQTTVEPEPAKSSSESNPQPKEEIKSVPREPK